MKRLLILLTALAATLALHAQGTVSGKVLDGSTQEPLEFATIIIYPEGSTQPAGGGMTDIDGQYTYSLPYGKYTVQASLAGYEARSVTVTVSESHPQVRVPRLLLKEDSQLLQTVEVTGHRSAMRLDIDKKVFNVSESIVTEGASATDILQNMPSVHVDTDGNISLRNSNAVEIWINGKPSGLSDTDKGDVLEMIPAESIQSVELITNPSSKYNPEGSAGIINIVLKDSQQSTYLANVSAGLQYQEGAPYPGGNLGFNYTLSSSKWDFSLNASARSNKRENGSYTNRTSFADGDTTLLQQTNTSTRDRVNGFLRGTVTYHATANDDIGMSAYGMYGRHWNQRNLHYIQSDEAGDTTYIRDRITSGNGAMGFYYAGLDYTHRFVKDRNELSAAVNYTGRTRKSSSDYKNQVVSGPALSERFQFQQADEQGHEVAAQVDYFYRIGKDTKIEAGGKAQWRNTASTDITQDSTAGQNSRETIKDNPFHYDEQIYALYASYGSRFDWFGLQLGLRGEESIITANGHRNHYFNLFPSAYLSFSLPKDNEIQLNYTRRINRPRGRRINNYVDRTDPTDITFGNPDLKPELANALELNYLKVWEKHTLTAGLFYRYTQNVIQQLRTDSAGYMTTTYGNLTYDQHVGIELISKNRLFKDYLDLTTTVSGYYYQLAGNEEYNIKRTETFSWQARINANIKIIDNLSAQLTGYYRAPHIVAQGSVGHEYALDFGLRLSLLKKSLTLSFNCRDLLDSRSRTVRTSYGDGFTQESANTTVGRNYRLNISYKFGNLKNNKKLRKGSQSDENMDFDDEF
ncbi:MAG: TonB-dependent receptor [Paludibacteraceae bacterium]|nr:TonB-dependent receptor [Paludibacteraceae bacterium]